MRFPVRRLLFLSLASTLLSGCTGLMAGPAQHGSIVVPVPRDSAWARARRAMTSEVFSVELADSMRGVLYGIRHPRPGTLAQDVLACRLHVTFTLQGTGEGTTVERHILYTVPRGRDGEPTVACAGDLTEVVDRMGATIATGR